MQCEAYRKAIPAKKLTKLEHGLVNAGVKLVGTAALGAGGGGGGGGHSEGGGSASEKSAGGAGGGGMLSGCVIM